MVTSLERSEMEGLIRNLRSNTYQATTRWKFGDIGQADPETICLKDLFFLNERVHADDPLKLRSYWTEVHQIYKQ